MANFSSKVEVITPRRALEYLKLNTKNRPKKLRKVKQYAEDMTNGKWDLNGESIKFDAKGRLLDGQNRLMACVMANTSFKTLVVKNISPENFATIDIGAYRNGADVFSVQKMKHAALLSASLRILFYYEKDKKLSNGAMKTPITNRNLMEVFDKNENIQTSIDYITKYPHLLGTSKSSFVFCHYIFSTIDRNNANLFFHKLLTGEDLPSGHSILSLRNRIMRKHVRNNQDQWEQIYLTFRTWQAFMNHESNVRFNIGTNLPIIN